MKMYSSFFAKKFVAIPMTPHPSCGSENKGSSVLITTENTKKLLIKFKHCS